MAVSRRYPKGRAHLFSKFSSRARHFRPDNGTSNVGGGIIQRAARETDEKRPSIVLSSRRFRPVCLPSNVGRTSWIEHVPRGIDVAR